MGALADIVNMGHWGRLRMWALAVAVAILGTAALGLAGWVDVSQAVTMRPRLAWLSLLVGGAAFGVGMTLAGGCGNKNLVRLGGGSLRSAVVLLVIAVSASMTLRGLFGQWRNDWLDPVAVDLAATGLKDLGLPGLLAHLTGLAPRTAWFAAAGVCSLGLFAWIFSEARFRANRAQVLGGAALGLLIVGGWYVSGHLGLAENPETLEIGYQATNSRTIESMSFVGPLAYGLDLLLRWTDQSLHLSFGIATAAGVAVGSLLAALAGGSFRWEGFASLADLRNQLLGGVLMGFGGVTALGCTIGQGLTGLSTMSIGSALALAGIVAGSVATLRYILWQAERD